MSKPKEIQIPGKNYYAWGYEEQTKVKHKVLGSYAKIWISKLGYKSNTIFFDCHGGCGAYIDDKSDISYGSSILVKQIADDLSKKRSTKTGVYYCEKDKNTYDNFINIKNELGNMKINTYNDSFENVISKPDVSKYYNTLYGEKYHFSSACAGKNATATTLNKAKASGKGACGKCAH